MCVRGYRTNINLISGATKENPKKEKPEKQSPAEEGSTDIFSSWVSKKTNKPASQQDIEILKNAFLQIKAVKEQAALAADAAKDVAAAEATKSTADKPPQTLSKPTQQSAPQPPP